GDGYSLKGRLGISSNYETEWTDESGQKLRASVYGIANVYYDFGGATTTDVSGTKLTSQNDPMWGGVGIGGTLNWADGKYALNGEASVNTSLSNVGNSYAVNGNVGFKVKW